MQPLEVARCCRKATVFWAALQGPSVLNLVLFPQSARLLFPPERIKRVGGDGSGVLGPRVGGPVEARVRGKGRLAEREGLRGTIGHKQQARVETLIPLRLRMFDAELLVADSDSATKE